MSCTSLSSRILARTFTVAFLLHASTVLTSTTASEFSSMDNIKSELFLKRSLLRLKSLQVIVLDDLQLLITWSSLNMANIAQDHIHADCKDR